MSKFKDVRDSTLKTIKILLKEMKEYPKIEMFSVFMDWKN